MQTLTYVVPEFREDRGEIAASLAGELLKLVKRSDVRGDLRAPSDWTDGTVPIAGMAAAAQARGYEYIALTDHSRRVARTHGLDPTHLARQSTKSTGSTTHSRISPSTKASKSISSARRAWLTANDVLNTRSLAELRKLLKR